MKMLHLLKTLSVVLGVGCLTTLAGAAPVVDGRFEAGEGYLIGHFVNLSVEGAGPISDQGQLWYYQDKTTNDLYVAVTQPLSLVDNTYGANSIGWGKGIAPSGKSHNFSDLVGSDSAQFIIKNGAGNTVLDFIMDYISQSKAATSGYASLGAAGGDGHMNVGSTDSLLAWATSLDYNFNTLGHTLTEDSPATDQNYSENPNFPGWVFEVTYEFRVDGKVFNDDGFGSLAIPLIHDSPNKIGKNKVYDHIDGPIPEPATIAMLGLGGLFFLGKRR